MFKKPSDLDYATALAELENNNMDLGLWARCLSNSGGDSNKAKSRYLRERASVIFDSRQKDARISAEPPREAPIEAEPPSETEARSKRLGRIVYFGIVAISVFIAALWPTWKTRHNLAEEITRTFQDMPKEFSRAAQEYDNYLEKSGFLSITSNPVALTKDIGLVKSKEIIKGAMTSLDEYNKNVSDVRGRYWKNLSEMSDAFPSAIKQLEQRFNDLAATQKDFSEKLRRVLDASGQVVDFLDENEGKWILDGNKITFIEETYSNDFNRVVSNLVNASKEVQEYHDKLQEYHEKLQSNR